MVSVVVDEVATHSHRMTLGQRQSDSETFREFVNLVKRLVDEFFGIVGKTRTDVLYNKIEAGSFFRNA